MKKVILDTSFILTCVRQKIDFVDDIKLLGLVVLVPEEVVVEIGGLAKSKLEAEVALKIVSKLKKIKLGGKNVDAGIAKYAKLNSDVVVATLDREIKKSVGNKKLIIKGKRRLEIV